MADVEDFVGDPSEQTLDNFTKDQLLRVAEHYKIAVPDKRLKETIKSILKANLVDMGILEESLIEKTLVPEEDLSGGANGFKMPTAQLTFEQQVELLKLQADKELQVD